MNKFYRGLFLFSRWCACCFIPHYRVCDPAQSPQPAVYLVHHQNLRGPILSVAWLRRPFHIWVLGVFCSRSACYRQYYQYTFTKRFGIPKILAAPLAYVCSFCVYALMKGMGAIPVYRGMRSIVNTFRESLSALKDKESLLIAPDVDYTNTNPSVGEMYSGFLDLEKYYLKETGKHLAFVPIHIGKSKRIIFIGNPICFGAEHSFKQKKESAYVRIKEEFSRLEKLG